MEVCFVCGEKLNGDAGFVQYHVASCVDRMSEDDVASPSTSKAPSASPVSSDEELAQALAQQIDAEAVAQPGQEEEAHRWPGDALEHSGDGDDEGCPLCQNEWKELGVDAEDEAGKQAHAEACLLDGVPEDRGEGSSSGEQKVLGQGGEGQFEMGLGKLGDAVQGVPGLIPVLGTLLSRSSAEGRTKVAYLCTPTVEHVQRLFRDAGWGCGYKNAQMLYTALRRLDCYATSDLKGKGKEVELPVPTILELQTILETAWKCDFDRPSMLHFKGKLRGQRKWIGTTEVYTAFTYLGIRANIVDFPKFKGSSGSTGNHEALINWVRNYFKSSLSSDSSSTKKRTSSALDILMDSHGTSVKYTGRQPLFLQHQGHSRTIVGFEESKSGDWLLLFDPSNPTTSSLREAAKSSLASATNKKPKPDSSSSPSAPSHPIKHAAFFDQQPGFKQIWGREKGDFKATSSSSAREGFGSGAGLGKSLNVKDYSKLLSPYRISLKTLSRNAEYQILYVEEGPLLTMAERRRRGKVIVSKRIDR